MIGSFLTRGLVMVFGYAYPAYECYKTVEKNKPEIQQLRFWCQYWILVAALTVFERVGDAFASWVPLYCEAKLAFFIYLWFPKTRGTTYVYDSFFKPYVAKHENEIDRNLIELRTKAGDMAVIVCRKAVCYGRTRITEILQFVALQSTPKPKPQPKEKKKAEPEEEEQKQPDPKATSQAAPNLQARLQSKKPQLLTKEPTSPKPISSSPRKQQQQQQTETKEAKASVSQTKLTPLPPPSSPSTTTEPNADSAQPLSTEAEKASQIVPTLPASEIERASSLKETIMEETLRVTRGSLKKTRSTGTR
ncbi:HVA22-like protein h [Cardamine amara subsp. amara]|uniref:HVA22-like protein n=1 Tax=Cardamine amara subsp. amara TaxID=228776 RepID=A0ABD0ZX90_CARAN